MKTFVGAFLTLVLGVCLQANAAVYTLTAPQLLTLSYDSQSGDPVTVFNLQISPAPEHANGTDMGGQVGLKHSYSAIEGDSYQLYYTVAVGGVLDLTGFDTFAEYFFNDNNSTWLGGLWIEDSQGDRYATSVGDLVSLPALGPPGVAATVSLDLTAVPISVQLNDIVKIGVIIAANNVGAAPNPSADDTSHMSFAPVPEPATLAIWGLGAMGVLVAGRFRRKLV